MDEDRPKPPVRIDYDKLHSLFERFQTPAMRRGIVYELLGLVDGNGLFSCNLTGLAEWMATTRPTLRDHLQQLQSIGWVEYHFVKGHSGGWIRLTIHDQVRRPNVRVRYRTHAALLLKLMDDKMPKRGQWVVYRHFDRDGYLLYVGKTSYFHERHTQHRTAIWWPEIVKITYDCYATAAEASAAELVAIQTEDPEWNINLRS